ncbi:hypothetical protein [Micromonospora sp. WMMC250]|uniref:hypothetical protein n=1 Tax=Micromonospora sp. WMMC250 TaxID=3014781 RepID=UPI0022B6AC38|nr:hypothetical protein [Micromonospora sp. WMMC250]MCZ7376512.1 hypothetical protein [Micromonospora sp. WMMC250]
MQDRTVPQSTTSKVLADPTQVAAIRDLITYARKAGAVHAIYSVGNGLGQPMASREHTWDLGTSRVGYHEGALYYHGHSGGTVLSGAGFDDARQVGDMLAAIGVLPSRFSASYQMGLSDAAFAAAVEARPDRRCRTCGATSGLILCPGNPLTGAGRAYECADGCKAGAR